MRKSTIFALLLLFLPSAGCEKNEAAAATAKLVSAPAATPVCDTSRPGATCADQVSTAAKVIKIVFVGKENACECTRKRVDAAWAELQKALGTPAKLPVELVQIDTERSKVEPYMQQKPIMALPAIYFLDGKNVVVELLQGEVTEAQITAVLKR